MIYKSVMYNNSSSNLKISLIEKVPMPKFEDQSHFDEMKLALRGHQYIRFNNLFGKMCMTKKYMYAPEFKKFSSELMTNSNCLSLVKFHSEFCDKKISYNTMRIKIFSYALLTETNSLLNCINWSDIIELKSNRDDCLIFIYELCFRICQVRNTNLINKLYAECLEWKVNNEFLYYGTDLQEEYDFIQYCVTIITKCKNISDKKFSIDITQTFLKEILSEAIRSKSICLVEFFIYDKYHMISFHDMINKLLHTDAFFLNRIISRKNVGFTNIYVDNPDLDVTVYNVLLEKNILEKFIFDRDIINLLITYVNKIICGGYNIYYTHFKTDWNNNINVLLDTIRRLLKSSFYMVPNKLFLLEHKSALLNPTYQKIRNLNIQVLLKHLQGFWLGTVHFFPEEIRKLIIGYYLDIPS